MIGTVIRILLLQQQQQHSVIFVNENENGEKRENYEFVNDLKRKNEN